MSQFITLYAVEEKTGHFRPFTLAMADLARFTSLLIGPGGEILPQYNLAMAFASAGQTVPEDHSFLAWSLNVGAPLVESEIKRSLLLGRAIGPWLDAEWLWEVTMKEPLPPMTREARQYFINILPSEYRKGSPSESTSPKRKSPEIPFEIHNPRAVDADVAMAAVRAMSKGEG